MQLGSTAVMGGATAGLPIVQMLPSSRRRWTRWQGAGTIADLSAEMHTVSPHPDEWQREDFDDAWGHGRAGEAFPALPAPAYGQWGRAGWYNHSDWQYSHVTDRYEPPSTELQVTGYESLKSVFFK